MAFQSFFYLGAYLENDSPGYVCVCVCIYICIFKGISCITLFLVFSVMAGEQRKCLYHSECYAVQKGCLLLGFFFKKKLKLTLTMLLNVYVSLLLLKINELVRWWRVSREVYKCQEWPVLLIFSFANNSIVEIITNSVTLGFLKLVFQTPGDVGCSMMAWHLTCLINFLLLKGSDFAGLDFITLESDTGGH